MQKRPPNTRSLISWSPTTFPSPSWFEAIQKRRARAEIHHGGFLCGYDANIGRIDWFDQCEVETWSPLWIQDIVEELGYDPARVGVYWLLPGKSLSNGLRIVDRDSDTLSMTLVVPKFKNFTLYIHQKDLFDDINLDDIGIVGSPELPDVISPRKDEKKLPAFYDDIVSPKKNSGRGRIGRTRINKIQLPVPNKQSSKVPLEEQSDSDSSYDAEFVDSDYEVDKDDDDLFEEWVDEHAKDTAIARKKATEDDKDSDYALSGDEEYLILPDSDDEGGSQERMKFRSFRPEDMVAPKFKVGILSPSVVELRKSINECIIQNRVTIKYAKKMNAIRR